MSQDIIADRLRKAVIASELTPYAIARELGNEPTANTIRNLLGSRNSMTSYHASRLATFFGLELK